MFDDIGVFIVTCKRDCDWIPYCLRSLVVFFRQCKEVHIVADDDCEPILHRYDLKRERVHYVPRRKHGYLQQQAHKLAAHHLIDKPFILFVDSDNILQVHVERSHLFLDGKPIMRKTRYSSLKSSVPWRAPTELHVGGSVEFEYMRQMPILYDRRTLELTESLLPDMCDRLLNTKQNFRFSEFNVLGAIADRHHPELYSWIDTDISDGPPRIIKYHWSWNRARSISKELRDKLAKG